MSKKDKKYGDFPFPLSVAFGAMDAAEKVGNLGKRLIKGKYSIVYIDKLYLDTNKLVENYELDEDPIAYKEYHLKPKVTINPLAPFKGMRKLTNDLMNDEDTGKQKTYKSKKDNDYGIYSKVDAVSKLIKNKFHDAERYSRAIDEEMLKAFRKGLKSYKMDDYSTFIYDKWDNAIIGFREEFVWE
jgi:hypothetical protein